MKLADWMVFVLEQVVESVLEDMHESDHEERTTLIEAARRLELMAEPWKLESSENGEATDGR